MLCSVDSLDRSRISQPQSQVDLNFVERVRSDTRAQVGRKKQAVVRFCSDAPDPLQ